MSTEDITMNELEMSFSKFNFNFDTLTGGDAKITGTVIRNGSHFYIIDDIEVPYSDTLIDEIIIYLTRAGRAPCEIIYTRVSAINSKVDNPCSLDFQYDYILTCLLKERKESEPREIIVISEGKRSAYKKKLKILSRTIDTLIPEDRINVFEINRLCRNFEVGTELVLNILAKGATAYGHHDEIKLTNKPCDIRKFNMAIVEAQYTSDCLSHRAKSTIKLRRKAGHSIGKIPYGMKRVEIDGIKKNTDCLEEKEIISKITKSHKLGKDVKEIVNDLTSSKLSYRGKKWRSSTIAYLLKREIMKDNKMVDE